MGPFQELLGSDHRGTLEFFAVGLRDVSESAIDEYELLYNASVLAQALKRKRTSLKAALSDKRVVSGLGNIYVCEALHRARLSPKRRASTLVTP